MSNPIPHSSLWNELSLEEIYDFIHSLPPSLRSPCFHVMMYTLNACHNLLKEQP